jgi:hypothetical protein
LIRRESASAVTAIVLGVVLVWLYQRAVVLVHPTLPSGPPRYGVEVWVASATLAFTFPLLNIAADFFDCWPVRRAKS